MKKANLILVSWIGILLVAYFIHGSPSEAYFPALFIPLSFLWGIILEKTRDGLRKSKIVNLVLLIVLGLSIYQISFLLKSRMMTYGKGLRERMEVAQFILNDTGNQDYQILALGPMSEFVSFLDNYRYLLWYLGSPPSLKAKIQYTVIEDKRTIQKILSKDKKGEFFFLNSVLIIKQQER